MSKQTTQGQIGRNIILTTPGSSGSTYLCDAINELPNIVALNEPISLKFYQRTKNTAKVCERLKKEFRDARKSLVETGIAKHRIRAKPCYPNFGKQREPFDLVIKQPLTLTALIGQEALEGFEWYALVRNPLITLCSWVKNRKKLQAGRKGRATTAEYHAPELKETLDQLAKNDASRDQLRLALLNWAFAKYGTLSRRYVIRYEDFVASPLKALAQIIPAAEQSDKEIPIRDGNTNPEYLANTKRFAPLILAESVEAPIWNYYTKDEVKCALNTLVRLYPPREE